MIAAALPLFMSQMRLGSAGVGGLDYLPCARIVAAQGVPEVVFATLFAFIESGLIAGIRNIGDDAGGAER